MRKNILAMLSLISTMVSAERICLADNPIVQTMYTADPAPMVHDGVFYVYTGHDEDGTVGWFNMKEWRVFSSTDMANWTDRGVPMNLATFSWAEFDAWAGQVVHRNGKFYFYAPVMPKNGNGKERAIGVGVATSPIGPFVDAIGKPLVTNPECCYIDPTVFVDDDGQAYMYWGNPNLYMVKLNEDMISYSGAIVQMPKTAATVNNMYLEAPWFYKRNGLYYLLYATNGSREDIRYSTSAGPTGPWAYRGLIMAVEVGGKSWTNHEGVADYKGHSYFVYHNGGLPGGSDVTRSVNVEEFKYNADGTIPTISMTKEGPSQIENLDPYTRTEAETIAFSSGLKTEVCSEGGMNVSSINNGDYIKVKGVDFGAGAVTFVARVASASSEGSIELRLDSQTGTLVGTCSVQSTGGLRTWATKSCAVSGATGKHDLFLKFTGGSGELFKFNWWQFTGSATGGSGGTGGAGGAATTGGTSSSGQTTGGSANGGTSTGGKATGGQATTGGSASGGTSTGGKATGGISTGGQATGGTPNGGGTATSSSGGTPSSAAGGAPGGGTTSTGTNGVATGGAVSNLGGALASSGSATIAGSGSANDDSGCSCRVVRAPTGWRELTGFGLVSLLLLRRARRTRARRYADRLRSPL